MEGHGFEVAELDALERVVRDESAQAMNLTLPLLRHITNDFSPECLLGRGGFGAVYRGVLPSGLYIAVKKLYTSHEFDDSKFEHEISITMKLAHKNTVRLMGYCNHTQGESMEFNGQNILVDIKARLICLEYVPNGSLDIYIDGFPGGFDWKKRYQILKGICQGLRYLHEKMHVLHGDIKPCNILIGDDLVPKIYDFGLSCFFNEGKSSTYTEQIAGTMGYIAPEMINDGRRSYKSDIYSLGVTITELLTGRRCDWREQSVEQVLEQLRKRLVKEEAFSSWENKYEQVRSCLEIGQGCMDFNPDKRPTALEIIQLLDEIESTKYSAPSLWQCSKALPVPGRLREGSLVGSYYEESSSSDTETLLSDEVPTSADMMEETNKEEQNMTDSLSAYLSNLKVLTQITDNFSHGKLIGKDDTFQGGDKAFVYMCDIPGQKVIAVKRIIKAVDAKMFKSEAELLMKLDHENIVKLAGYCQDESIKTKLVLFKGKETPAPFHGPEQLLCYEYMHNGSLRKYLIDQGSREMDWGMRYELIKGICNGLHHLHQGLKDGPILHLNLNPSNVLLDKRNVPHITGFDFTKFLGANAAKSMVVNRNVPNSTAYLPPDIFSCAGTGPKYFTSVDIYSLGLMILEIATRQEIEGNHEMLIKRVKDNWTEESQIARLYTSLEADKLWQVKMCIDIGLHCVKSLPTERPTAGDIIRRLIAGAGGVPRSLVHTNITHADGHIQENKKRPGFLKQCFGCV